MFAIYSQHYTIRPLTGSPAAVPSTPLPSKRVLLPAQELNVHWVNLQLENFLEPYGPLLNQLQALGTHYDLAAHLKRHFYPRIVAQIGYQLQRDPELWRIYTHHFHQSLLAQMGALTEKTHQALDTLIPNVFQITHLCTGFAEQSAQQHEMMAQRWDSVVEQYQTVLQTVTQTQQETAERLEKLLETLWEEDLGVEWIGSDEIRPITPNDKRLILGQTIEIRHIREDRFMHRPDVLQDVWETLHKVVAKAKTAQKQGYPELFTLWINGRSGSGKSVLLLQLLQRLVLEKQASVLWLQDNSLALPELVKRWARLKLPPAEPVFIFLDDFYDLQAREELDLESIARALRSVKASQINWPILITCSPPENMNQLIAECPEKIAITPWLLPKLEVDEVEPIKEWYKQKTGQIAQTGSAFEQDEGLFVSMMVEIEHGHLDAFARRFKNRLEAANLIQPLTPILALNRLYLWTPVAWFDADLSPEQQDAFDLLNEDGDFTLNKASGAKNHIRLTHPHVSNAIYNGAQTALNLATNAGARFNPHLSTRDRRATSISFIVITQNCG